MDKIFHKSKGTNTFYKAFFFVLPIILISACFLFSQPKTTFNGSKSMNDNTQKMALESNKDILLKKITVLAETGNDPIKEMMNGMSNEELLGQMLMVGFTGTKDMDKDIAALISQYKVGGIILFGWNTKTMIQTKELIDQIKASNPYPDLPLFIGLDVEGGIVARFKWKPRTTTAATLGKLNDPQKVYEQFLYIGQKLKETGININFAPVLDIAPNPSRTFLRNRMYGADPQKVMPLTNMAIKGLKDGGVIPVGKHFPGHGMTKTDSHKLLPVIETSKETLYSYTFKPFISAIENGMDGMMVGHLVVLALDGNNPATMSKTVITGILRGELKFNGLVFSDDMRMGGITKNYDIGEACVRFIEAGGDVVMIGKYIKKQTAALQSLYESVKSGRITRERLMESAYRIISAKLKIAQ